MTLKLRWKLLGLLLVAVLVAGDRSRTSAQQPKKQPPVGQPKQPAEPPVLLRPPQTPVEYFRAAILMHKLARPNLARKYLEALMKQKLDDKTLLLLRDKFGPADFLVLAREKKYQPLSTQLLDQVNAAVRRRASNPKYIDTLIKKLNDPNDRDAARVMLRNIGPVVIPRLLQSVTTTQDAEEAAAYQGTLVDFGPPAVPALIGAMDSPQLKVKTTAINALGYIGVKTAVPYLWYPAFSPKSALGVRNASRQALARIFSTTLTEVNRQAPASVAAELKRLAMTHFRQEATPKADLDGKIALWHWSGNNLEQTRVTPRFASLFLGTRFAKQALEFSDENRDSQALFIAMSLSAAADPKWERPLPNGKGTAFDAALSSGAEVVNDALALSLKVGDPNAAIACLIVLRQLATKNDLRASTGEPPIVRAMNFRDQRVQFAAAETVLTIDPNVEFRGISRVVPILARALNNEGSPTSLVVNANLQKASILAGHLTSLGFDPRVAQTGREGFKLATSRGDVELILLQANVIRWPLSQTLANLRADSRTAGIPIAIYGPDSVRNRVQNHLRRYDQVTFIVESTTSENTSLQLKPFLAQVKTPPMSDAQRLEQRKAAAYWLAFIASGKRSDLYDLKAAEQALIASSSDPEVIENVLLALGGLPSKAAQQTFYTVITSKLQDSVRVAAATQLNTHIQRYGLLLTNTQIDGLRRLQTTTTDRQMATALASLFGILKPGAKQIGEKLENLPLPKLPASKPMP